MSMIKISQGHCKTIPVTFQTINFTLALCSSAYSTAASLSTVQLLTQHLQFGPCKYSLTLAYKIYFTKPIKTNKHTITKHVVEKYAYQKSRAVIMSWVCAKLSILTMWSRIIIRTVLWRRQLQVLLQLELLTNWTNIIIEFRVNGYCLHPSW